MFQGLPSLIAARYGAAIPPILDTATGAAAAYSLRLLKTGATNCVRVRRSSDNTEQDIGFVGSVLDASSLTTFVGAGDGFVSKWYDQSGNSRDASQATTTKQPQIVSSGSIITLNGKYAIQFDGTDDFLGLASTSLTSAGGLWQCFAVVKFSDGSVRNVWDQDQASRVAQFLRNNGSTVESIAFDNAFNPFTDSGGNASTNQVLLYAIRTGSTVEIFLNNSSGGSTGTTGTPSSASTVPSIGSNSNGGFQFMKGNIQELIHYPDNSSYQSSVTSNINTYYAIY